MIYQINFSSPSPNLFYKLEKLGDFIYAHNTIYLQSNQTKKFIQSKIKSKGIEIFIQETNQNMLQSLPNNLQEWCKIRLIAEEKARYERENQEALKELNDLMDEVERELASQVIRKEVLNATSQENTGDNS